MGIKTEQNPAKISHQKPYFVCLLAGIVGGAITILCALLIIYIFIDIDFIKNAQCSSVGRYNYCFFDSAWDSAEYLSTITSFYSSIITLLIGLLAVIATLAFLVIRASAKHHVQETLESEVQRYFETRAASQLIESQIESISKKLFDIAQKQMEEHQGEKITNVQSRLERLIEYLDEEGFVFEGTLKS